ncbi:septum formation initiator family protein [uncultured Jatrophihabitans sp.]|uniref:septum formation initiator family protein n=1 Tax=uncultured Jatrophihabitans sp. TaxID=1610747 RepID=UPI0035CB2CAF
MARRRSAAGRPVLTGRALVLGALVVLLVVLLAPPVHRFLRSRSDIGAAAAQLHADRAALRSLAEQRLRWGDPGYIQRQARARLQFAMPGDTVYVVVDKGQRSNLATTAGQGGRKAVGPAWNTRLWDSVRAAAG